MRIIPVEDEVKDKPIEVNDIPPHEVKPKTKNINKAEKKKKRKANKDDEEVKNAATPTPRVVKTFVPVHRTKEIELVRSKLPIIPEEQVGFTDFVILRPKCFSLFPVSILHLQVIMESITENSVTVLAGETGSGKTTQVPQFLYEAGYSLNGKLIGTLWVNQFWP